MNLEEMIKRVNLRFTNTVDKHAFSRVNFDLEKADVNLEGSISLYELVISFNKLYTDFKKKYDALEKFDFCKEQYPDSFSEIDFDDGHYRCLDFLVEGCDLKSFKQEDLYLTLREIDGKNSSFITTRGSSIDPNYLCEEIKINDELVKKYLDLFQEYNFLMELFYRLIESPVFSDGTHMLFSKIKNADDMDVMFGDDVDYLKLSVCTSYFDLFNIIDIYIKLGEELSIDLDKSAIELKGKKIDVNSEMCIELLKKIYINGEYLEELTSDSRKEKGAQKVKKLKGNN